MAENNYSTLFTAVQFLITYGISPLVIYQLINRFFTDKQRGVILAASFGLGPVFISWVMMMLFLAFPGYSYGYYIAIINGLFLGSCLLLYRQLSSLSGVYHNLWLEIKHTLKNDRTTSTILLFVFGLLLFAFLLAIFLPYSENDALEYAMLAKIMYQKHTARMYPIFDGTPYGGFIAPFTHPLAYTGLYVWSYFIRGGAETFGLIRIIAPYFAFSTILLILSSLYKTNRRWAALAALLYLATPLFFAGIIRHQIETIRLFTFFNLFMFLPLILSLKSWQKIILGGFLMGMCLYCHSFNILSIPIFIFVYWVLSQEQYIIRAGNLIGIMAIGLLFVLPRYYINLHTTGHLIQDGTAVRAVSSLHFKEVYEITHNIASFSQKWLNGFFRLFYNFMDFGFTYLLLLFSLAFIRPTQIKQLIMHKLAARNKPFSALIIGSLVLISFFGMVTLSILIGDNNFIASSRYMMSMQPFVAIIAGWVLSRILKISLINKPAGYITASIAIVTLSFAYPINNLINYKISPHTLFDDDFAKAKHIHKTFRALNYIQKNTPKNATILSFRNAETAYYAKRNYIYHTDPKMVEFYQASDSDQAFKKLRALGIDYIVIPEYPLAYIDQSRLVDIIGNPEYSDLVYQDGPTKIFQLHSSKASVNKIKLKLNALSTNNKLYKTLHQSLITKKAGVSIIPNYQDKNDDTPVKLTSTHNSHKIGTIDSYFALKANRLYQLSIKPEGSGMIQYYLLDISRQGQERINLFNQTLVSSSQRAYTIQFQSNFEKSINLLLFDLAGTGSIKLNTFDLYQVTPDNKNLQNQMRLKTYLLDKGWQVSNELSEIRKVFHQLKKWLGYHSYNLTNNDVDWEIKQENHHIELVIDPIDSLQYFIDLPNYQPDELKNINYSIRGQGTIKLALQIVKSHDANSLPARKESMSFKLTDKWKKIALKPAIFKALSNLNTDYYVIKAQLIYRKPSNQSSGLVELNIPYIEKL